MDANEESFNSFKSADESESEEEFLDSVDLSTSSTLGEVSSRSLAKSASKTSLRTRPSAILPKRTIPKRQAPQPPTRSSSLTLEQPLSNQKSEENQPTNMASFVHHFRSADGSRAHFHSPKHLGFPKVPTTQINSPSSAPITDTHSVPNTPALSVASTIDLKNPVNQVSDGKIEPEALVLKNQESLYPPNSFSNLRIRLIDDESDLENDKRSTTPSTSKSFGSILPSESSISSNLGSPSPSISIVSSNTPPISSLAGTQTDAPCSAGLTGTTAVCTFPPFQNLPFSPIYENVVLSQHMAGSSGSFAHLAGGSSIANPYLAHLGHPLIYSHAMAPYQSSSLALVPSTIASPIQPAILPPPVALNYPQSSDIPDVSGLARGNKEAFITSSSAYSDLNRLSDDDQNEGDDYSEEALDHVASSSPSWDYVTRQNSRQLKRSDSIVTVAHIYEDIIVSPRLKVKVTLTNLALVAVVAAFLVPNSAAILFSAFRLVFGTLFPAYYSYKAVRTKNIQEYVKWMMYWIVFAFFTCVETVTDVLMSFWFPFYYEIKILVVLWLLSPATKGSSILYRKFVHPWLTKREGEIDECIAKAKQQGYSTVVELGTKGVNYATSVIMQTAIKGGGGIVNQLKRSYSASEISEDVADMNRNVKPLPPKESIEDDDRSVSSGSFESEPRHRSESESSYRPRGHSTGRAARASKARSADVSDVYFHDVPESVPQRRSPRTHEPSNSISGSISHQSSTRRSRTGEVSSYATLPRTASKRAAAKKRQM